MSLGAIEERTFHYKTNSFYKTEICKITIFYFYIYIFFYHQYSNFNTFTNYTYGRIHEVMQQKHTVFMNICFKLNILKFWLHSSQSLLRISLIANKTFQLLLYSYKTSKTYLVVLKF